MLSQDSCVTPSRRGASLAVAALAACLAAPVSAAESTRTLTVDDFERVQSVDSPACTRDGSWIVYTVTSTDKEADELHSAVWLVNWMGNEHIRLTSPTETSTSPRFSPDARFVSFLSARGPDAHAQLYVLDRHGGEAQALTSVTGEITDYSWAPDGHRIVLAMVPGDATAEAGAHGAARPRPVVIDRRRFKVDERGYLGAGSRSHLYLLDVATHALEPLTSDARYDDLHPAWSPDGALIAFTSGRESDPEETGVEELYVVEPKAGAAPRRLAKLYSPNRQELLWLPDSKQIAYSIGGEAKINQYMQDRLAVAPVGDGSPRVLAERVDRSLSNPILTLTGTGAALGMLVADDRSQYPATLRVDGNAAPRRMFADPIRATEQCGGGHHVVLAASNDVSAPELYALEEGKLRKLTGHNDALMQELHLGAVEDFSFKGADGDDVHGFLVKPPGYEPEHPYPTIVWLHGGPNGQDEHGLAFDTYPLQLERQLFAAHGYVVLAINYHGSSGRGARFAAAMAADWGNKEVVDVLAGVNFAVEKKIADPERLGVGGWSYGGILTDYVIASDPRFKAAISGAGSANQLAMFGADEYILAYDAELGPPWKATDRWLKISYPFYHADRIKTPTLFLGGDHDFNVPIAGGEQMYEALRLQGVPTQLVVYPGQTHLFSRPSFIKDRAQRYLQWFDRYLKAH